MKATVMRAIPIEAAAATSPAATHRHTSHEHEHEFEPQRGLPEPLPAGEHVLWQGAPDWRVLARECFHVRKLSVYFAVLIAWRVGSVITSGGDLATIGVAAAVSVGLAAAALGLATLMAWMSAKTSLYTITDRRVVMRVGIVLSVTFNLPYRKIVSAGLHPLADGHGDIALALDPETRIAYPHLWPHVRPWHVARTQPDLRGIADAAGVARILTSAWREERSDVAVVVAGEAAIASPVETSPARPVTSLRPTPRTKPSDRSIDAAQAA